MATIAQLITDAYQVNNLIGLTETPSAAEQDKALRMFNRIFRSALGYELGERLPSLNIGTNGVTKPASYYYTDNRYELFPPYFLPANYRFVLNLSEPITAYLPTDPEDGARIAVLDSFGNLSTNPITLAGNGRKIEGQTSVLLDTDNYSAEWFFRSDLGEWVKISNLAASDDFPLPTEYEEYFIMLLNIRLLAGENVNPAPEISPILSELRKKIRTNYRQTRTVKAEPALIRLTNRRYLPTNYFEGYRSG